MSKPFFILLLLFSSFSAAEIRPNILLLMAEDMSSRVGAFGDEVAVTPNIDKLANEGTRYTNVYTAAGVCAPSRAAHIMGMHQISFGGQHMRTSSAPKPVGGYKAVPPVNTKAYPELLRVAGYYTWTNDKLDYQFSGPMAGSGPFSIWHDERGKNLWRDREEGQPFYGLVNFNVTHESGVMRPLGEWPNSVMHLVMQVLRKYTEPSIEGLPLTSPEDVILPPYYPDTATVRADVARHYNNITIMDAQVGEILAQLETDGLADSTIVIWTTDHGDGLPRAKRELFDSGLKVPMIIRWPEAYRPEGVSANVDGGGIETRMISFVDFAPTILSLAGEAIPEYQQGHDFVNDESQQYIYASRDRIDVVQDRQRAVRDNRYKYIRSWYPEQEGGHKLTYRDNLDMVLEMKQLYADGKLNADQRRWFEAPGEEQLYDTLNDPHELNNLVTSLEYQEILNRMRDALAAWQGRVEDWSETPEAEMVADFKPDGKIAVTATPKVTFENGRVVLSSASKGASLGYQINDGKLQVYTGPIDVKAGSKITAKAVRYGWKESKEVTVTVSKQ